MRPDGVRRPAALSLGRRPDLLRGRRAVVCSRPTCSTSRDDLYDEPARVEFVAHLRSQARFESTRALIDQMARDVTTTRHVLGKLPTP